MNNEELEQEKKEIMYRIEWYLDYLTNDDYDIPDNLRGIFSRLVISLTEEVNKICMSQK